MKTMVGGRPRRRKAAAKCGEAAGIGKPVTRGMRLFKCIIAWRLLGTQMK